MQNTRSVDGDDAGYTPSVSVVVEVVPQLSTGDLSPRSRITEVPFEQRSGELAEGVARIAGEFKDHLDDLAADSAPAPDRWMLDQVQVEFSLALAAEGGLIVAKASAETTFRASLTWKRPMQSSPSGRP